MKNFLFQSVISLMKNLILITPTLLLPASCAYQEKIETNPVPPPLHPIYGNWKSENNSQSEPSVVLSFQENDLLRVEVNPRRGKSEIEYYDFQTFDNNSATFYYTRSGVGKKISADLQVVNHNELKLQCRPTNMPRRSVTGFLDPPLLCFFNNFQRIEN
ncbi:MAG: hypothetical protein R2747_17190 [Pyrinomonadaceae bacterium]